ncbi:hypothetical protein C0992_010609 [Termitomyces sp. T32_za158]|nr:hypothetical protein C0992_010609 [Termitomyces sp. T32_za158]
MSKSLTKVIYKPDHTSTDEYTVIVNPEEVSLPYVNSRKAIVSLIKAGSIVNAEVFAAFDIFHSNQGHQGRLGQPSKQQLENDFGTSKDEEVVAKILESGKDQGSDRIGSAYSVSTNVTRGHTVLNLIWELGASITDATRRACISESPSNSLRRQERPKSSGSPIPIYKARWKQTLPIRAKNMVSKLVALATMISLALALPNAPANCPAPGVQCCKKVVDRNNRFAMEILRLAHIDPGTGGNIGLSCTPYVDSCQYEGGAVCCNNVYYNDEQAQTAWTADTAHRCLQNRRDKGKSVVNTGVQPLDVFQDAAESLSINISDVVASALASDVEYRIHQVIEEAARFMRHGRRTTLTTSDIEQAFRVLNIEPLYGHTAANPPVFRKALPFPHIASAGPVYFVEDEEIDFDRVLREEKIALPKGVSWTAHWLAVEGVQPLIPENPPAIPRETDAVKTETLANGNANGNGNGPLAQHAAVRRQQQQQQQQQQLVKQVLSRELQLYYSRLTESLLPPTNDFAKRTAALASLRNDAGLQALLPYLIRWVGEGVVGSLKEGVQNESDGKVLEVMMDVVSALLENNTLFVEPYLHQILPPVLSTLLHSSLPPSHATHLRTTAAQTLSRVLTQHSTTYPSLSPRIMKTLLLALISPGKSKGTREGAIRGLVGVGKEAVRKGLVEGGGARVVESECRNAADAGALVNSVMDALRVLQPTSDMVIALEPSNPLDAEVFAQLREMIGEMFAQRVAENAAWARTILGMSRSVDAM